MTISTTTRRSIRRTVLSQSASIVAVVSRRTRISNGSVRASGACPESSQEWYTPDAPKLGVRAKKYRVTRRRFAKAARHGLNTAPSLGERAAHPLT